MFYLKFCDVKKFIFAAFLIGIGIGIGISRIFGLGCFFAFVFIGFGVWRML